MIEYADCPDCSGTGLKGIRNYKVLSCTCDSCVKTRKNTPPCPTCNGSGKCETATVSKGASIILSKKCALFCKYHSIGNLGEPICSLGNKCVSFSYYCGSHYKEATPDRIKINMLEYLADKENALSKVNFRVSKYEDKLNEIQNSTLEGCGVLETIGHGSGVRCGEDFYGEKYMCIRCKSKFDVVQELLELLL